MADRLVANPLAAPVPRDLAAPGLDFHRSLPGYEPTPLLDAPAAARALGVERVLVKDESGRLGLPSFKILGASWAAHRALAGQRTLTCATDGNHGRAVARVARLLGLGAIVFVPDDMVPARREAIAAEGAEVRVVHGTYDEAVDRAAALAGDDVLVVQDTGDGPVPAWVVEGYATIGAEIGAEPELVAVQIGVGSFAAAMVRRFAGVRLVGVEPATAACALASAEAGEPVAVPGPHASVMAGLNCGRVAPAGWPLVSRGIEAFAAIDDGWAREAVGLLAQDGITAGESGAAGLAGLLAFRDALDLPPTVLVINTEGQTDSSAHSGR